MRFYFLFFLTFTVSVYAQSDVLSFSRAFELALQHEPDFKAGKYKAASVEEGINQAKSKLYPKVDVTASGGKYEYESFYNGQNLSETYKTYALSLTQPIYHPEALVVLDQANTKNKASKEDLSKQEQQLAVSVAKAYFKILQLNATITQLNAQKKLSEAKYQKVVKMIGYGLANNVNLLETKSAMDKAKADWIIKKKELLTANSKLEHLIGKPVDEISDNKNNYNIENFSIVKALWREKLANNKDSKVAFLSKKIAQEEVNIRQYEHYPKVDLSLGRNQNFTNDLVAHKFDNKAFVQIAIPIYQGGYTSSRVQEASLLLNAAEANIEAVGLKSLDLFDDIWTQREALIETVSVLHEAEESAQLYLKAVKKGNKEGIKDLIDILDAEAKLEVVHSDLVNSFYDLVVNEVNLLDVTGELTLENIQGMERILLNN